MHIKTLVNSQRTSVVSREATVLLTGLDAKVWIASAKRSTILKLHEVIYRSCRIQRSRYVRII